MKSAHKQFTDTHAAEMKSLQANNSWQEITEEQRQQFLNTEGISNVPSISVGSDDDLLRTLDGTSLSSWRDKQDALPNRFANAAMKAAQLLEPKTVRVHLTSATLKTEDDVKAWIAQQEQELLQKVKKSPIVIS